MIDIISNYAIKVKTPEDSVLREAFANLTYGKQSDSQSSDKEKVKSISYRPPNSSQNYNIDYFTAYTYITIPHEELKKMEEEDFWITSKATVLLETIRQIMKTETFHMTAKMIKEDFTNKLYDDRKRSTLPKFLSSSVIRVTPVNFITDHLVQSTANDITGHLFNNRLSSKKYEKSSTAATDGSSSPN